MLGLFGASYSIALSQVEHWILREASQALLSCESITVGLRALCRSCHAWVQP